MDETKFVAVIAIFIIFLVGLVSYASIYLEDIKLQCISKVTDKSATEILLICGKK